MLWIPVTLVGALAQTGRNMAQAGLTRSLGTLGATQVRFLYGLPFALVFLLLTCLIGGVLPPVPSARALAVIALGGLAQIGATALMLATMERRSFAVSTAWLKTEPVLIAIGGVVALGDHLNAVQVAGIVIATAGVILTGWRRGAALRPISPSAAGSSARPRGRGRWRGRIWCPGHRQGYIRHKARDGPVARPCRRSVQSCAMRAFRPSGRKAGRNAAPTARVKAKSACQSPLFRSS
jgi:uncharacterized membrane protein